MTTTPASAEQAKPSAYPCPCRACSNPVEHRAAIDRIAHAKISHEDCVRPADAVRIDPVGTAAALVEHLKALRAMRRMYDGCLYCRHEVMAELERDLATRLTERGFDPADLAD